MSCKNGVLEGSGLDFGDPGLDFEGLGARFWRPQTSSLKPPASIVEPPNLLPSFGYVSHIQEHNLTNVGLISGLEFLPFLFLPSSKALPKFGRRRCPPLGPSIRRPPKVCQRRAKLISNWLCPITAGQSRHSFAQFDLKCFFPYPFLSPPAWGSPEPSYKFALSASCWGISAVFFAFRIALEK